MSLLLILKKMDVLVHQEKVTLFPDEIRSTARIDKGAARNSIYAINEEVFAENGQKMIRFTFIDHEAKAHTRTRLVIEKTTIQQASGKQTRYVVEMGLCVGKHYQQTEFTLAATAAE